MNIAIIRAQYLNNFELQSYYPMVKDKNINLTGFSSLHPQHRVKIKTQKLFSPTDLPNFPYKLALLNRLCFGDAMYLFGLEKKLKNFDIAHVRETYFHFSSQAINAKKINPNLKILTTCSETIPFNHETILGRKRLKQKVLKNTDHFHTLTQKAKDCLIKEGVEESKITVIPYGIDLTKFTPIKNKPQNKSLQILFIGRLEKQKGIHHLLNIWPKLKSKNSNINLKIIGKGPLENLVKKQGLTSEFHPYSQIPKIMQQADVLVLPSQKTKFWEEYFGMVLLEAMASKLPIVTTDCGAIPEVIGNSALIAKQNNPKSLFQNLNQMIQNPNLRKKYSTLGYNRVTKNFDTKIQSKKLKNLYLNL